MSAFEIAILTGYYEGPFFYEVPGSDQFNHTVEEAASFLGLTVDLAGQITAWDDEYQATLDIDVPQDSGFPSPEVRMAWIERGKELAARIKRECPLVGSVDYQADGYYEDGTCVF